MKICNISFIGSWAKRFILLVCMMVILTVCEVNAADESKQTTPKFAGDKLKIPHSYPYCGLYCVYTMLGLTEKVVDFRELVKPEYVGSNKGSSMVELKRAAEDHGLNAVLVDKFSSKELRICPYPIILHVKSDLKSKEYNHYELFFGTENGKAKLLNSPEPVRLVPFDELTPRWDGNALIVSSEPIDLSSVFGPARKRLIIFAVAAIAIILALHRAKQCLPGKLISTRIRLFGLSVTQAGVFAMIAFLCGMLYHFCDDAGLLSNANATAVIQKAHAGNFIPKISEMEVHKLLNRDAVFIDARLARDYKDGHMEGAISLPVDANDVELQKATANISKDSHIVMYCQSAGCKFAEIVAIKLIDEGFSNISIYKGGWAKWVAKNGKKEDSAS